MTNLPVKGGEEKVIGVERDGHIQIINSNGFLITDLTYSPNYLQGLATTIATLITDARDTGFEQGRKSIRDALGIF